MAKDRILKDDNKFKMTIEDNPSFNFILLPSTEKGTLQGLHFMSVHGDDAAEESSMFIGVLGTRFDLLWKVI